MSLRWSGSLAIALVLGCTGSNPAFDHDTTAENGTGRDEDGTSTGLFDTGEPSSEDSGADDVIEDTGVSEDSATTETTDTDPTGGVCSQAPPMKFGTATSLDARECPSEGFIRGPILEIAAGSFSITDCGECSVCSEPAPTWTVTIPDGLVPEVLRAGDCLDVLYDCNDAASTDLRNLALMQGRAPPLLVMAAPSLPVGIGSWAPTIEAGAPCPTDACPQNHEIVLQFLQQSLVEGDVASAHVLVGENEVELEVHVVNAHYDPSACEPIVVWVGKG